MVHQPLQSVIAMCGIVALLLAGGVEQEVYAAEPAEERTFHFHHWQLDFNHPLKHATEGLWLSRRSPDTTLEQELATWRERGVVAQRWRGGRWAYKNGFETPEKLVEHWGVAVEDGWDGIVIDEITGDREQRRVAGQALLMLAEKHPGLYVAVYVVPTIFEETLVEGLSKGADRVLLEAYLGSSVTGYGLINSRAQSAVDHGLIDKSLIVLGFGPEWITTPRELRRQLHFLRYHFPQMDGAAFFGDYEEIHESVAAQLDQQLETFYSNPVLRVEQDRPGQLRVCNIGAAASPPIEVSPVNREGMRHPRTLTIPALGVSEESIIPSGKVSPEQLTQYGDGWCVLGPPLLWTDEPAWMREGAQEPWPTGSNDERLTRRGDSAWNVVDANEAPSSLAIHPFSGTRGDDFRARIDLTLGKSTYGTEYTLGFGSPDSAAHIRLALARRESISGTGAFFTLVTQDQEGRVTHEDIALPLKAGERYAVDVLYESRGNVRVKVEALGSGRAWDTGFLPAPTDLPVEQVKVSDQHPKANSIIRLDPEQNALTISSAPGDAEKVHVGLRLHGLEVRQ